MRTIEASTNPELKTLWKGITDITFVRDYRRKKKQQRKRRAESDEECIEEMFSQVGTEQEDDESMWRRGDCSIIIVFL